MSNKWIFWLFLIGGTLFLLPSLYRNQWQVVEPTYYTLWEQTYERVVVARLAKSRQDGIFSAGGLLGLANTPEGWNFDLTPQYEIYQSGMRVEHYLAYKSHPGGQGIVFGAFDALFHLSPQHTLIFMRLFTALASALTLSLLAAWLAVRFAPLAGILVLLFSASSEWIILPAANSYWSLWAFYVPFLTAGVLLERSSQQPRPSEANIYFFIFGAVVIKVLFTGFEMITTTLLMTTVPFLYFAIEKRWKWHIFTASLFKASLAMMAATFTGLLILAVQIAVHDGSLQSSSRYLTDTLGRRSALNVGEYKANVYKESKEASLASVIAIYLSTNAFHTQTPPKVWQLSYGKLIALFGIFTAIFAVRRGANPPPKGLALMTATWYSILAPLSWYVIFKPTAYVHTFLFPMAWQMPFTLLGVAFCGYVIADLFTEIGQL